MKVNPNQWAKNENKTIITIVAGKYKGQKGVVHDFTKSKVYIYLTEENNRLVLLPHKSVFGKDDPKIKKDPEIEKKNENNQNFFKSGELVTIIRGKYIFNDGYIKSLTPKMAYVFLNKTGTTVRIMQSSVSKQSSNNFR